MLFMWQLYGAASTVQLFLAFWGCQSPCNQLVNAAHPEAKHHAEIRVRTQTLHPRRRVQPPRPPAEGLGKRPGLGAEFQSWDAAVRMGKDAS